MYQKLPYPVLARFVRLFALAVSLILLTVAIAIASSESSVSSKQGSALDEQSASSSLVQQKTVSPATRH